MISPSSVPRSNMVANSDARLEESVHMIRGGINIPDLEKAFKVARPKIVLFWKTITSTSSQSECLVAWQKTLDLYFGCQTLGGMTKSTFHHPYKANLRQQVEIARSRPAPPTEERIQFIRNEYEQASSVLDELSSQADQDAADKLHKDLDEAVRSRTSFSLLHNRLSVIKKAQDICC